MINYDNLLLVHLLTCFTLLGLILTIQFVHYPSFLFVSKNRFLEFENFHTRRISLIVMPLMMIEFISGLLLLIETNAKNDFIILINFMLLTMTWLSTFFLSVPIHRKLSQRYNSEDIYYLIKTNWPRTIFWSLRSVLLIILFQMS